MMENKRKFGLGIIAGFLLTFVLAAAPSLQKQFFGDIDVGNLTVRGTTIFEGSVASSTGAYTFTDNVFIDGQADVDQLTVQGWTTQTSNLLVLEQSDGTDVFTVTNDGALQIAAITDAPLTSEKAIVIGDEWDIALDTVSPIVGTAVTHMDDFLGDTVLALYTEVSGTDAEAVQAIQEEQFGAYQLTSGDVGNTAADLEAFYLSLEWQADQGSLIYETRLHLDTAITTVEVCAGFTDDVTTVELPFTNASDTVTAVADDAVMFCFDTGSTTVEWFVNGAAGGTEATGIAATGVAPAQDVYQTLRIEIDDGGADCRFYIDGALVGTLTANCITNTDLLAPGIVISSGGASASHVVDVDYMFAAAARD